MFYAHFVLAKKGPLSKIWLAAHWDKKLTKAHVFETNIETSVDGILKPKVKMALRTSGHLLLGVVRIYSRKAKYLLQDCNEAFVKIKMAFRPGMVDLPEEHREAAMNAITLPEVFHDFDTAMPELNEVDIEAQFSLNQSRAEEITMREDYGSLNLVTHDDGFGDMGFDTDNPDIMREAIGNEGIEQSNLLFADGSSLDIGGKGPVAGSSSGITLPTLATPAHERRMEAAPHAPMDDGFGGTIGDVSDDFGHAGGLFEGELFGEVSAGGGGAGGGAELGGGAAQPQSLQAEIEAAGARGAAEAAAAAAAAGDDPDSDDDMGGDHYDAGVSPAHSWGGSPAPSPRAARSERAPDAADLMPPPGTPRPASVRPMDVDPEPELGIEPGVEPSAPQDNTTLLQNDEESFALAPVDATVLKGITKTKRKRKLIVDEVKNLSGEEMKNQLSNTADIVSTLDLAPPTKRLMHWKETGGVEKLFTLPARPIPSRILFKKYQRNMTRILEAVEGEEPRIVDAARLDPPARGRPPRKRKHEELAPPDTPAPLEPAAPVPQEYEPSIADRSPSPAAGRSPRDDDAPATPGMLSSLGPPLTPGPLGPLTPGSLGPLTPGPLGPLTPGALLAGGLTPAALHGDLDVSLTPAHLHSGLHAGALGLGGGLTPAGLHHGGMTPGGLDHGGLTPAGLTHGGLTPAGLAHGGLTPAGLQHGGLTPAGLQHGGMTPAGLLHGGMTPAGLHHGGMTPVGLGHGGMTPAGLTHGGMTPAGLTHGGMTPAGLGHGGMTPAGLLHGLEAGGPLRSDPSLQSQALDDGLRHHGLQPLDYNYQPAGLQMTNLGYDDGPHSPPHDYDLPPSVEQADENEREAGETDEQFEERVLNRRAAQLFALLRPRLQAGGASFADIARHNHRKQAAQKFYSLLVLKKHQVIKIEQRETYGPLLITRGEEFETEAL